MLSGIITVLLMLPAINQAGACDEFALKKLLKGPPRSEYRGQYVNRAYHYSVKVPEGLTAYDVPDPANHEGFGLAFGEPPQSYVFVRGEHNSLEYDTPREAATRSVEYLHRGGKKVESETTFKSHLGTLDAVLLVASYTCPASAERYILSAIVALSPDKRFVYELDLYSLASRYDTDRTLLNRILKSWKVMPNWRQRSMKRDVNKKRLSLAGPSPFFLDSHPRSL